MPPAFILSQDQTLHEIPSYITYSFLVCRQSGFGILFQLITCIHALTIRRELPPRNIIQSYTTLCQPHIQYPCAYYSPEVASQKYYTVLYHLMSTPQASYPFALHIVIKMEKFTLHWGNRIRTEDFHHVKVTLYR